MKDTWIAVVAGGLGSLALGIIGNLITPLARSAGAKALQSIQGFVDFNRAARLAQVEHRLSGSPIAVMEFAAAAAMIALCCFLMVSLPDWRSAATDPDGSALLRGVFTLAAPLLDRVPGFLGGIALVALWRALRAFYDVRWPGPALDRAERSFLKIKDARLAYTYLVYMRSDRGLPERIVQGDLGGRRLNALFEVDRKHDPARAGASQRRS